MKKIITHINPLSFAKISCIVFTIYSFFLVIISLLGILFSPSNGPSSALTGLYGMLGMIIFSPIWGFVIGWILGFTYNWSVKKIGGIEINIEDKIEQ